MTQYDDFDVGGGGSEGPWIAWSARGTLDGQISPKSFLLRDQNGKTPFDGFSTGVVIDTANMRTGWQRSEGIAGQAPDWKWNASTSRFEPSPGDDYKRGFSVRCAIGGGRTATWEQAGAAAWNAIVGLVPALRQAPPGDVLPLVRMTGTKVQQFKRGSTVEPVLEVVKWVPRPDCLKADAARIDTGEHAPAQVAQTTEKPAPKPAPAAADTDLEF